MCVCVGGDGGDGGGDDYSLRILVDLHGAVEPLQLFREQLQVGVHVAQLQKHHLAHFVVGGCPGNRERATDYYVQSCFRVFLPESGRQREREREREGERKRERFISGYSGYSSWI